MSEQSIETDQPGMTSNIDPHPDPFPGNSVRLKVEQPIEASQFQEELERRTKSPQVMVSLSYFDDTGTVSKAKPGVLFVSPKNISERVIADVVANHVPAPPEPVVGAVAAPTALVDTSTLPQDLQGLLTRLEDGETLKTAEISDVLRGLLGITPSA